MTKAELKHLVAKEYLEDAFEILKKATAPDPRLHNRVITQNSSFSKYSWATNIGTISRPEEIKEHAQVVDGLLDTIDKVPASWLNGIPFPLHANHLLEEESNGSLTPSNPSSYKYLWLLAVLAVVLAGVWGISTYLNKSKEVYSQRMTINLQGSDSNTEKPLKNGQLMILFEEGNFSKKSSISNSGQVFFDSIPIELNPVKFTCQLITQEKYKLKDKIQKYALAKEVNVIIEKMAEPINSSNRNSNNETPCPTTSPDGASLDTKIYKPHEKKLNHIWIPGKWKMEDGRCIWENGHFEKLTLRTHDDCPTEPPAGTDPDPTHGEGKPGFFWQPSRWVLQDGKCTWRSGSWQRRQAGQN
jgi:Effector-associated domain 11